MSDPTDSPTLGPLPQVAVGGVILDVRGETPTVLLVKRRNPPNAGRWSLPGGKVRFGESLREALVREMREECGIAVTVGALVDVVEISAPSHHYVILDYRCEITSGVLTPGDDALEAVMVPLLDLADFGVSHEVKRVVAMAFTAHDRDSG